MQQPSFMELTILYVEDDAIIRMELEQTLRRWASQVLVAENGEEGLQLFRQGSPDLVITDIRMPVMNGLAMSQAIKELSPEVRIIATTAHSESNYLLEAIEIGIDHYVTKPIELAKLKEIVLKCGREIANRKLVEQHHAEREKLLVELQAALDEIKVLHGILPICSYCKNIRNDQGYWEQIEAYISRRTEAEFSHSICLPCMKKHHPEEYEQLELERRRKGEPPLLG